MQLIKKIKGFKGFNKTSKGEIRCRRKTFKVNALNIFNKLEYPVMCAKGFHFCKNKWEVLDYYNWIEDEKVVLHPVEAYDDWGMFDGKQRTKHEGNKSVTNSLFIKEEINKLSIIQNECKLIHSNKLINAVSHYSRITITNSKCSYDYILDGKTYFPSEKRKEREFICDVYVKRKENRRIYIYVIKKIVK